MSPSESDSIRYATPPPRLISPAIVALGDIRSAIAEHFHGALTAQDQSGWRPHVTIQNKVPSADAKALFNTLTQAFEPRPLAITGLALHRYMGGPWAPLGRWPFRR